MNPADSLSPSQTYQRVARAIAWLRAHAHRQPSLEELATAMDCSPFHLQRQFSQWAGVSPKRFVQYLTKEYARSRLAASANVFDAALDAGLSGPSRLHDLLVTWEAMTPGEVRAGGAGLTIHHAWLDTPFGEALLGWTARGVSHLAFVEAAEGTPPTQARNRALAELHALWPNAHWRSDAGAAAHWVGRLFPWWTAGAGGATPPKLPDPVQVLMRGSPFQLQVWQALVHTRAGAVYSYQTLARQVGKPGAARAVGSAMAANTLALLIPCHRVIRGDGDEGGYRWGPDRKAALLAWEANCSSQK